VRAARAHAAEMASQNQLSHQFSGEPSLTECISASATLHLVVPEKMSQWQLQWKMLIKR